MRQEIVEIKKMDDIKKFEQECEEEIEKMGRNPALRERAHDFMFETSEDKYTYHFNWMGLPIIQYPQDIIAMQELIWNVKPDMIIETGVARGGSVIFYSSMLELIGGEGRVIGIDIDIREHNRKRIEAHPMNKRITLLEGSSTDEQIIKEVNRLADGYQKVLVILDSLHSHDHVLAEIKAYSPLVKRDSYLVVFDTAIEDMTEQTFSDRPWGKGDNPKTAVWEFLKDNDRFEIDKSIENKLLITVAPDGYLKCIKD
jgi:cephalosporin hydroxylase